MYHARRVRLAEPRQIEANSEHMELLVAMGFSDGGARHALVRSDNNLEAAINLLTSIPAGWEPPTEAHDAAAEGDADVQDAAEPAQSGINGNAVDRSEQDAANLHDHEAGHEAATGPRAGPDAVGDVDGASDDASVPQPSGTGSDVASADEEHPLLGIDSGSGRASARPGTAASGMPDSDSGLPDRVEEVVHGDSIGDAAEHIVADVLQEDVEHLPLDAPTMMELQEGMRGLMTALNATTAGIVNDATGGGGGTGGPMSGAMPILATGGGGDAAGMLDPMRLVDEIRWGGAFPAMLGGLLSSDVDQEGLAFGDYQSESTVYADDDGEDSDDDGEEEDDVSDTEN